MKRVFSLILLFLGFIFLVFGIYINTKFHSVEIELGDVITKEKFISYGTTNINIDLSNIKNDTVGEYSVPVQYMFLKYNLSVKIVDKKSPQLEVKDVSESLNYSFNIKDFIVNASDESDYDITYSGNIDTSKYGEYDIVITAKDIYDNTSEAKAKLYIGWLKKDYSIEYGNKINAKDLVYDEKDKNTILQSDLDEINASGVGVYYLTSTKDDCEEKIKIEITKDVTPPELVLKSVTIYFGKKINSVNDFVSKATDKSGKVTLNLLTKIDYNKIGKQKITIEAVDIENNKVTKETTLNIIKDTAGPKISGLSKLTVNKGTTINYEKGVSSYDDNTGKCEFSVDNSKVDTSKYGTYHAIYTSSDSLGNKTTAKRVIIVNHDASDTNKMVKSIADTLSSDAEKIRDYVRNNIKYNTNWGGSDPIWYGLTNKVGNCYVHAKIFEALLKAKGYETKLIWTTDKTHYWNMVVLNGKWVHMDSTPSSRHNKYSIMNDEKRYERLQGRNWDRSLWPKAE